MNAKAIVQDHPAVVSAAAAVLVVVHSVATSVGWVGNLWSGLEKVDVATSVAIYLGILGTAAIVAGFAGVVIVFGLSPDTPRFQAFRLKAGDALKRTWSSTALSGFEAALLAGTAAVVAASGAVWLAPWFFELAVLLLAHGAMRLIWIMRGLIDTTRADDQAAQNKAAQMPIESFGFKEKP